MNHKSLTVSLLVLAAAPRNSAFAQEKDTTHLGTVVVSASKVPRPASTLTQAVTVLLGEDLRARGVTRVSDALREVPGAMLVQNGSYGAVTSLFLRGGESRYTKVLIDGVPVNASGGFFDFSHLTTDNIERIEIVRGPASVLYGADAVSGIVQIFTRRGSDEPRASLGARAGTYRSFDVDADAAGDNALGQFSLGAAHHSTDGILPFNNQYRNGTLSSALTLGHGTAGDARVSARYTAAEFHYPTDFAGQPVDSNSYRTQHRLTVGLDAGRNLSPYAQARFLAGTNEVADLTEDTATPFGATAPEHSAFRSRGYRRNAEGRLSFFLPANATVTLGANYEKEHERSSNGSGPVGGATTQTDSFDASRNNLAYYSELLGNPDERFSYTLSGRVDDNSDYHRFGTYRIGASAGIVPAVRLRASLSTAFNAPAFNQLRPTLYTVGSPALRPERIRSAEVGLTTSSWAEPVRLSAIYFTQRFSDLIQYVNGGPPSFKGSYANLTGASSNGYEAELALLPSSNWRGSASYTIVNPRVTQIPPGYQGGDNVGDALIRRPSHSGSVVVTYSRPASAGVGVALNFVGKRADTDFAQFPSPRVTLSAYTKLDISAELPITAHSRGGLTLNARVENALNKRYEDALHFAAPGRTVLIGARASTLF
ncbi:MAG TPA: TonB-dependent receptor [Gemmatimonadaceae bacterium]|nr:TonB-dependent receptor [Gemmatimonadaceae bacterium]